MMDDYLFGRLDAAKAPLVTSKSAQHLHFDTTGQQPQSHYGKPGKHHRVGIHEFAILFVIFLCCSLCFLTVFNALTAAALGLTRQLIGIGFLLSIMAYCAQGRIMRTLATMEVFSGKSSLQNLQALIQMEVLGTHVGLVPRVGVLLLLALPLCLSVAYKSFVGGVTIRPIDPRSITFGMTPPPTTQNLGYGLSLFSLTMLPFWTNPQNKSAYGYSLWVDTATQVALLDSPLSDEIAKLQTDLRLGQRYMIRANVSAVQAEKIIGWDNTTFATTDMSKLPNYLGLTLFNSTYEANSNRDLLKDYFALNPDNSEAVIFAYAHNAGIALGADPTLEGANNTFILISRSELPLTADSSYSDIFFDSAQGFLITLEQYEGTWNITSDTATLASARPLDRAPIEDPAYNSAAVYASIFQDTYLGLPSIYAQMLAEFDWKFPWARFDETTNLLQNPANQPGGARFPYYTPNVTSDAAFAATMVWSRAATKWGPTSPEYLSKDKGGPAEYTVPAYVETHTSTLRADWKLGGVFLVLPLLTVLAVLLRACTPLGHAPVSTSFGLISVLAAVRPDSLYLLHGAGYTGKLKREVYADFAVCDPKVGKVGAVASGDGDGASLEGEGEGEGEGDQEPSHRVGRRGTTEQHGQAEKVAIELSTRSQRGSKVGMKADTSYF